MQSDQLNKYGKTGAIWPRLRWRAGLGCIHVALISAAMFAMGSQKAFTEEATDSVSFSNIPGMERADVCYIKPQDPVNAVLVLCPGDNDNGSILIQQPKWRDFASQYHLGLAGIFYVSPPELIAANKGYYDVEQGSGACLLKAVQKIYGKPLPLLLYGCSGGAHFTSRFVEWAPTNVLGWCAYSAGWWNNPANTSTSPAGIVACGELDGHRYAASLNYFKSLRNLGRKVTWVSVPNTAHAMSPALDDFVRQYFTTILNHSENEGQWRDITTKAQLNTKEVDDYPSLACWLPNESVTKIWMRVHTP